MKLGTIFAGGVGVVLLGLLWFQYAQNQRLRSDLERLSEVTATAEAQRVEIQALRAQLEQPVARLPNAAAETSEIAPVPEREPAAATGVRRETSNDNLMREMAKLIEENPAMNEMITVQQRGALQYLYRDLVSQLNLNEEEEAYFMDLLLARQMQQVALGMLGLQGTPDPQELADATAAVEEMNATVKEEMRKFLNSEEDFKTFERFENTVPIRMEIDGFAKATTAAGDPLTPAAYEQIVDLVYAQRETYPFSQNMNKLGSDEFPLTALTDQVVDQHMEEMRLFNSQVAEAARNDLTPAQFELFQKNQDQMLRMQDFNLRMAAKLFRGDAAPAPAE